MTAMTSLNIVSLMAVFLLGVLMFKITFHVPGIGWNFSFHHTKRNLVNAITTLLVLTLGGFTLYSHTL